MFLNFSYIYKKTLKKVTRPLLSVFFISASDVSTKKKKNFQLNIFIINGELKCLPEKICAQIHTIPFQLKPAKLEETGLLNYRLYIIMSKI